jgi:hypothetical protein
MHRTIPSRSMVVLVLVAFGSISLAGQSEPTLRQMAIEHGGAGRIINACGPAPSLADIVQPADLIVEAIVNAGVSYLTADERDIYTDYDLTIVHVLFQRQVLASSRPGVAAPIVFKSNGGRVVIDGLIMSVDIKTNDARIAVKPGDHAYLFAKLDPNDGKWRLNPYDVFAIIGTEVVPPGQFKDLSKSVPQQTFLQSVRKLLQDRGARPF